MTIPRARTCLLLTVMAAALVLAGCGGSDDSGGSPRSSTTTLAADPASSALARRALFTAADLGAGWTQYQAGKSDLPLADRCGGVTSTFFAVPGGTFQQGPIFRLTGDNVFIQTTAVAFKDEDAAKAYVTKRTAASYLECFRKVLDQQQKARDSKIAVTTSSEHEPGVGSNGLEGYTKYVVTSSGTEIGDLYRSVYRFGRVVLLVGVDFGRTHTPNVGPAVSTATANAVGAARGRVEE